VRCCGYWLCHTVGIFVTASSRNGCSAMDDGQPATHEPQVTRYALPVTPGMVRAAHMACASA
jgi:hypothetical protein